jgi:hypothetical protein
MGRIWVNTFVSTIPDKKSDLPIFLATAIDITDRHRAENELRRSASYLAAAVSAQDRVISLLPEDHWLRHLLIRPHWDHAWGRISPLKMEICAVLHIPPGCPLMVRNRHAAMSALSLLSGAKHT